MSHSTPTDQLDPQQTRQQALALLKLYMEWGVDEAIEPTPQSRLGATVPSVRLPAPQRPSFRNNQAPRSVRRQPPPGLPPCPPPRPPPWPLGQWIRPRLSPLARRRGPRRTWLR